MENKDNILNLFKLSKYKSHSLFKGIGQTKLFDLVKGDTLIKPEDAADSIADKVGYTVFPPISSSEVYSNKLYSLEMRDYAI